MLGEWEPIFILLNPKLPVTSWSHHVMNLVINAKFSRWQNTNHNVPEYAIWMRFILSFALFLFLILFWEKRIGFFFNLYFLKSCSCYFGKWFLKMPELCFWSWEVWQGPERAATATSGSALLLIPDMVVARTTARRANSERTGSWVRDWPQVQ